MKVCEGLLVLLLAIGLCSTQAVFISEYVEGSSNNKALELCNPTGSTISLEGYTLELYSNGAATPSTTLTFDSTANIPAQGTFVLAHGSAASALADVADLLLSGGGAVNFNGDDAIVFKDASGAVLDSFGQVGVDPGNEWTGGGLNDSLRRKNGITTGDADPNDTFDASVQWEVFPQDTFDGLGSCITSTPIISLSIAAISVDTLEGNAGTTPFVFEVQRSGDTSSSGTVDYAVSSTEADASDFAGNALPTGTLTFNAGESSVMLSIDVNGDAEAENDEAFTVTLSNASAGATIVTSEASLVILNDDAFPITLISAIQGTMNDSPMQGMTVKVKAVVIGDFQDGDADEGRNLRGFFLQEEDGDADMDVMTSEGIFVFDGSSPAVDVNVGDLVEVTGTVSEFFDQTQISATQVTIFDTGVTLPSRTMIMLPSASLGLNGEEPDLEAYEGMLVTIDNELFITEMFQLDRFNEIRLVAGERPFQFTQQNSPDATAYTNFLTDIYKKQITYDDGLNLQNVLIGNLDGFGPTFNTDTDIRMGDTISDLTGVLTYTWAGNAASPNTWRIRSTTNGENVFVKQNIRPLGPPSVGGDIQIASFNVLNFFTTLDVSGNPGSGPNNLSPRGADSQEEFDRQLAKLVTSMLELSADIYVLAELENEFVMDTNSDGKLPLDTLVGALNAVQGSPLYDMVDPPSTSVDSGDAISVGFIYRADTVAIGDDTTVEVLTDSNIPASLGLGTVFDGPNTNRAVLAATFQPVNTDFSLTIAACHFKSKGGSGTGGDADAGDGQGSFNQIRTQAATAVSAWLDTDPTGSDSEHFAIIGDLNSYAMEDPIIQLSNDGYTNVLNNPTNAYGFVFDGFRGTLDYALVNAPLQGIVSGAGEWQINADEPDALDYNLDFGRDSAIFDSTVPYRSSDHDPVIFGIDIPVVPSASPSSVPSTSPSSEPSFAPSSEPSVAPSALPSLNPSTVPSPSPSSVPSTSPSGSPSASPIGFCEGSTASDNFLVCAVVKLWRFLADIIQSLF